MSVGLNSSQFLKSSGVPVVLPVKISHQHEPHRVRPGCICEISTKGAKLMKLDGINLGDVLWISRHTRRAKFKVAWIGQLGSELEGKIGVELLEPEKFIWDDELRAKIA